MPFKKNIVQSVLWRGGYLITALLLNVVIARYFKAIDSGWIYYITSYFSFIILVMSLSLESGMAYYGSRNEIPYNKLSFFGLAWSIAMSLVIALFLFYCYHNQGILPNKESFIFYSLTYITGTLLTTFYSSLFYARKNFSTPNLVLGVTNILLILVAIVTQETGVSFFTREDFLKWYFSTFMIQGILLAITFSSRKSSYKPTFLSRHELKKIFQYSMYALLANIIFFLLYRIDYWFVKNRCSVCIEGDLGNYIQVSKLAQLFLIVPNIVASVVFPVTAGGNNTNLAQTLKILSRNLLVFSTCSCLLIISVGYTLFPFVFGESFNRMYMPFVLLTPGIIALAALYPITAYYAGMNRLKVNIKGSVIALLVIIAGNVIFIPVWGINAAAATSSCGYLAYYIYVLRLYKKDNNIALMDFFFTKRSDIELLKMFIIKNFKK